MEDAPTFGDDRHAIGGNLPPSPIDFARETFDALSKFLLEHPAIVDGNAATEAKLFLDRAIASQKDVEDARDRKADPIYARWKAVREPYAAPIEKLKKLIGELKTRMTAWALKEEAKRKAEAAEAARKAEEARQAALAAEAAEREAIDNAAVGDLEADVGQAVSKADTAFEQAQRADRAATVAERNSRVRIGGGFSGRAASLKRSYAYVVDDAPKAIVALWPNEDIRAAIEKAARAYDRVHDIVPDGVRKIEERKI